ncbi:Tat pathway signal protein [Catellatospora methionotrophica]|uniref:Tat pathway signal protein n=1 Tax=Catellatospora methionotrophica TaxID=121620 RepID=UPI0033C3E0E7
MAQPRTPNVRLAAAITEAGWSHGQVASALVRVASEVGAHDLLAVGRSHVSKWVAGFHPSGRAPELLAEAFSRRLGRTFTSDDLGLTPARGSAERSMLDWDSDTLIALNEVGKADVDEHRRRVLGAAAFSLAGLALPPAHWWPAMAQQGETRARPAARTVGRADLEMVRETSQVFSKLDQRRGGGHARAAVVTYLRTEVANLLVGNYADDGVRRAIFSTTSELAYLAGWMSFDNAEHVTAQHYFTVALKLAAEADDPPMAGHIIRAMAHQAIDLGHLQQGMRLAEASMEGRRYAAASPRERALLGVVHARGLSATGRTKTAAAALLRAEDDLAAASPGDDEPSRVFFFSEASLAHETACALRDTGDLTGAVREFRRSVRARKASTFTRTHAVTLGYLGAVQARQGAIDEACGTWSKALDAMDGVHSARARQTVVDMRRALSPFRRRNNSTTIEVDARAAAYLAAVA